MTLGTVKSPTDNRQNNQNTGWRKNTIFSLQNCQRLTPPVITDTVQGGQK